MTYLTNLASVGLMGAVVAQFVYPDSRGLVLLIFALAVVMLVGSLATTIEAPHGPHASGE